MMLMGGVYAGVGNINLSINACMTYSVDVDANNDISVDVDNICSSFDVDDVRVEVMAIIADIN